MLHHTDDDAPRERGDSKKSITEKTILRLSVYNMLKKIIMEKNIIYSMSLNFRMRKKTHPRREIIELQTRKYSTS